MSILLLFKAAKNAAAVAVSADSTEAAAATKRHAPITFESSPPKVRSNPDNRNSRQPYVVPTGKFSANVSHGAGIAVFLL